MTASVHRQPSFYQPRNTTALPSSQTMALSMNCNNSNRGGSLIKRDTLSCDDIVDHCNNNSDNDNNSVGNNHQTSCHRPMSSNQIRSSNGNNPYAKISLEKLNHSNLGFIVATPPHHPHHNGHAHHAHQHQHHNNGMSQSYHPHSIFYGQQYHRIQPQQQTFCVNQQVVPLPPQPPPLRLTDSFEQLSVLHRNSGSSFRSSSNTNSSQQSPPNSVLMTESMTSTLAGDIIANGLGLDNTPPPAQVMVSENPYECIPAHFNKHVQPHQQTSDQAEAVTRFDSN